MRIKIDVSLSLSLSLQSVDRRNDPFDEARDNRCFDLLEHLEGTLCTRCEMYRENLTSVIIRSANELTKNEMSWILFVEMWKIEIGGEVNSVSKIFFF